MKVHVRYFGRFAAEIGKFSEEIDMPYNSRVTDLLNILRAKYPNLRNEVIEVSIGGKYAREEDLLGEEVSVYPIISGG